MLYRTFLKKKKQFSYVLSEFVIFLKLVVLWWKLKILIANFSHVSPNRFWRIISMFLHSHPTIKLRWKNYVAIILMPNHNLTGLKGLRKRMHCFNFETKLLPPFFSAEFRSAVTFFKDLLNLTALKTVTLSCS